MPAVLKLTLLGPFRASDSTGREIALRSRKARALLAYLALNAGTRIERERLAALLWDDSDTDAARTSLRQALASLRRALPDADGDVLLTDASSIAVDPDAFDCDAARVRSLLLDGRIDALIEAMELYRGDLLAGFESHSNAYEEWLAQERRVLRRDLVAGVERLVRACAESHDSGGQLEALTRLLAIDPSNERAHRSLMQLHAALGDHTAALRQYRLCREALRRDLDVAPEPATEALYREIMKRRRADRPAPADSATANEETDAVVESDPPLGNATMREAIVVAVRLPGMGSAQSGLDPEEARSLTTSAAAAVREAVERHGGAADRPMGERMLAVFGIGKTRGNEPAHAAAAASEIAIELGRTHPSLPPAIGVAAGQLLPASQDDVFPLAGPAVGAAIDLSQSAAQHEILLSDAAQRALIDQRGFMVTALDPPRPGLSGRVWRLDPGFTAPGGSSRVTPFSGRHAEVSLANGLVERAVELRRGRTLLVRGEPGIGKTRLVEIVRRIARERGLAEHVAVVLDCGQSQAQRPLAVLATSLLGIERPAGGKPVPYAALEQAAHECIEREDLVFLAEITGTSLPEHVARLADGFDLESRQHGRARVLARLVEHACESQPRLLVVEDVHWARPAEAARLADLAGSLVNLPAILLMSTRPDDDPCTAQWRARARGCPLTTLDLAPLADDEALELAAHHGSLDAELIADCLRRASGHPLFLDQLLRAASSGERTLPGSVRALALAKIDRLPPAARDTLQAAAVLGLECTRTMLGRLLGDHRADPAALANAGLLIEGAGDSLVFAHALFRDAVYESMLTTTRLDLHRRAADAYGADDPALRAWHLEQARDPRAAEACLLAARCEQEAHRAERALAFAGSARRLAREPAVLCEALQRVGELEVLLGRTHDAIAAYREAIDVAPSRSLRAHAWFGLASALRVVDRYEEALDALDRAGTALEGLDDPALQARIWSLRGNLHFPRGELDECLAAHRKAGDYAKAARSPVELARALGGLGDAWYQRGRMQSARDHYERCVSNCVEHRLTGLELSYLPMLACTRAYCGPIADALRDGEAAAEKARRIADVRADMLANDVNASLHLYTGNFARAQAAAERTIELARRLGARRFEIEASGIRGLALVERGQHDHGLAEIKAAAEAACDDASSYCAPWMLGVLAHALPDPGARRAALERGAAMLSARSVSHNHFEFYRFAIDVALEEGWWHAAVEYAAALEAYTNEERLPWSDIVIERARALVAFGQGDRSPTLAARLRAVAQQTTLMGFGALLPALSSAMKHCPSLPTDD